MVDTAVTYNLHKSFGDTKVLDGISFKVQRGEAVCILGRSGVVKTILLKILVGLIRPDQGKVEIFGKDIFNIRRSELLKIRENIGFVFQSSALFDSLSVFENIAYPFVVKKVNTDEIKEKVAKILEMVDMKGLENLRVSELSGGMQKRVAIARALVTEPELILYDEPTLGLDPVTRNTIIEIMKRLTDEKKKTTIIVTHDLEVAVRLSDRILFLYEGKVKEELTPSEILEGKSEEIVKLFETQGGG